MKQVILTPAGFIGAYDVTLARFCGDIVTGIYMTQHNYWQATEGDEEGWIQRTDVEWEERTLIPPKKQYRIRQDLKRRGYLEEKKQGLPCRLYTRLVVDRIQNELNFPGQFVQTLVDNLSRQEQTICPDILIEKDKKERLKNIVHFDQFWEIYPRKEAKTAARRAWVKERADEHWAEISKNIPIHPALRAEKTQFIPLPATYLNQRRWEDEIRRFSEPVEDWLERFGND